MVTDYIKQHPAYLYAVEVCNKNVIAPRYVRKQCKRFLKDIESETSKYFLDEKEVEFITNLTKLINMSTGLKVGMSCYEALVGFQWFFIINVLCVKHKDDKSKRRFTKSVLLISRKNGKSMLCGLLIIILMILEPEFSEFYTIAPDRELSSIVKKEVQQMIDCSPAIKKYFKSLRTEVRCELKKSKFQPLACSDNRLDGRLPTAFIGDEIGALRTRYPISAMESGMINTKNKLGILISTAYPSMSNPMTEEVEYAQKVLDDIIDDDELFALIYKPDNEDEWATDKALLEANPLMHHLKENFETLKKQRAKAIEMPSELTNFKTKHLNIFVSGDVLDTYVSVDDLQACKIDSYDWYGKEVWLGVDLSQTTDNTAVAMLTYDSELKKYVSKVWCFIPSDALENKMRLEKVPYDVYIRAGVCFTCGTRTIDYRFVEDFVLNIQEQYGVSIKGIAYDKYNALSSVNRWEAEGLDVVEQRQTSSYLHGGTKKLQEVILNQEFSYEKNQLLEINFENARLAYDSNNNMYINKRRSMGRIDMLDALINCMCIAETEELNGSNPYEERGFYFI